MPPSDVDTVTELPSMISTDQHLLILRISLFMLMAILFGISVFYVVSDVIGAFVLASVVSLAVILFTAVLFIGYDALRNHQQVANNLVLESKRLFVRYVSHEIRNPLNTVHLGLKLLVQEMQEAQSAASPLTATDNRGDDNTRVINAKLKEWISLIEEIGVSTERVVTVLNELIHSDDLASGTLRVLTKSVDLWEVVENSVQQMRGQAVQNGVSLTLDVEVNRADVNYDYVSELKQLRVVGDATKLEQVMCLIVGTSVKKARSGGQVIVTVFWEPDEDYEEDSGDDAEDKVGHQDRESAYEAAGSMVVTVVCSPVLEMPVVPPHLSPGSEQLNVRDGLFSPESLCDTSRESNELGLWIAKNIIELHHGRFSVISTGDVNDDDVAGADDGHDDDGVVETFVHADSLDASERSSVDKCEDTTKGVSPVAGQQCCFRIEFPAIIVTAEEEYGDAFSVMSDELKEAEAASTDSILMDLSYNVLVVDDSAPSRKLLCRLLSNLGCRCTQAQNGVECIEIVHRNQRSHSQPPFDFILLDYEMPRLNGPDAARTLRREGIFTPIIGVTGNVLPEDQQYFQHAGANCVLRKPLSLPSLEKALMDIIMRNDEISYIL